MIVINKSYVVAWTIIHAVHLKQYKELFVLVVQSENIFELTTLYASPSEDFWDLTTQVYNLIVSSIPKDKLIEFNSNSKLLMAYWHWPMFEYSRVSLMKRFQSVFVTTWHQIHGMQQDNLASCFLNNICTSCMLSFKLTNALDHYLMNFAFLNRK